MFQFIIKGLVQGIGFRPFIKNEADALNVKGYVLNKGDCVEIVCDSKDFLNNIKPHPLAEIESVCINDFNLDIPRDFKILDSNPKGSCSILPADMAICKDCEIELENKGRRAGYYFISCTNCGPRFSISYGVPYDRNRTAMKGFKMCDSCLAEYKNSKDKRFHAQTIACKDCGPRLFLKTPNKTYDESSAINQATNLLKKGEIIAIKGYGGFHLVSTINNEQKIRDKLERRDKPFAVMVRTIKDAKDLCNLTSFEEELLVSSRRPILVCDKKIKDNFKGVSELSSLGIFLPYSALQILLLNKINEPLIMTSLNYPGEAISKDISKSEIILDYFLSDDRDIINRCDDSVIKVIDEEICFIRRSRGYSPLPIFSKNNNNKFKPCFSSGAELMNTFCLAWGNKAFLSQHIGNTSKLSTMDFFKESLNWYLNYTGINPLFAISDLHPDYLTTKFTESFAKERKIPHIKVQHHEAHVASVAFEYGLDEFVGISMDGAGYGSDGNIWGGEVFLFSNGKFKRVGHLEYQYMPGSDNCTNNPRRMLYSILYNLVSKGVFSKEKLRKYFPDHKILSKMIEEKFNTPLTSSAGRILDASACLLGLCNNRSYEGRAAMILESFSTIPYDFNCSISKKDNKDNKDNKNNDNMFVVNSSDIFRFILKNLDKDPRRLAATCEISLAKGLFSIASKFSNGRKIVASGGVLANKRINSFFRSQDVLLNHKVPPGDGGISLGQIMHSYYSKNL